MYMTYSIIYFSWTVVLHRSDGSVDLNQDWHSYGAGFGAPHGEYWLGNAYLHYLTNSRPYKLRFDLEDWDGNTAYAEYSSFRVTSEADKYRLLLGDYSGNASADIGNDRSRGFLSQNNTRFSTRDEDNDNYPTVHCALRDRLNPGWYRACLSVNPTADYCPTSSCSGKGQRLMWQAWTGWSYSLKTMKMMMLPVDY